MGFLAKILRVWLRQCRDDEFEQFVPDFRQACGRMRRVK